jgi:hypothetical protein
VSTNIEVLKKSVVNTPNKIKLREWKCAWGEGTSCAVDECLVIPETQVLMTCAAEIWWYEERKIQIEEENGGENITKTKVSTYLIPNVTTPNTN